jgi:hypothetical protein
MMDAVHAFTFRDKVMGTRGAPGCDAVVRRWRTLLRQAQRFDLEDDSTRLICHLSHEEGRLEGWSFLARLPYDTLFIDINQHAKVQEFGAMNKLRAPFVASEVSPQIGYLMHRDEPDGESPRWVCHGFQFHEENDVLPHILSLVFDPEGDPKWPTRGSKFWNAPTLSLRPGFPKMPVDIQDSGGRTIHALGDPEHVLIGLYHANSGKQGVEALRNPDGSYTVNDEVVSGPDWLMPRMAVILNPWWEAHLANRLKDQPERTNKLIMTEVRESAGALRWLVTMLAAINGLPRDVVHHTPRTTRHSVGMYQLPYLGASTISLKVPRENRLVHARKALDKEARLERHNRRHTVIGHWRVIERSKRGTYLCRHSPVMVEHNVGMCERCQLLVRWIESHERGDATLGRVEHKYVVET